MTGALGSLETDFKPQFSSDESNPFWDKYRLICFEPAGYGRSRPPARTWPNASFLQRDAADCGFCLNELGIQKANLIGWSDGGITAICMAGNSEYSHLVEKMVIWGSNATMSEVDRTAYLGMRDVANWSARMRASFEAVYGEEFPGLWADWVDSFITYLDERNGDVCLTELKQVTVPTLIIHGDKDPMVGIDLAKEIESVLIDNKVPVEYKNIPDGKHNLHFKYKGIGSDLFLIWNVFSNDFLNRKKICLRNG